MTDAELVLRKLAVLEEHVQHASHRRPPSPEDGYASIDVERLWQELPTGHKTLQEFAQEVARFVGPAQ
jgi:hypothetical protein